jgi:hypothetical protein
MKQKRSKTIYWRLLSLFLVFALSTTCFAQSKISATKSMMSNLKTALINYKADFGYYPFAGNDANDAKAYFIGPKAGLGFTTNSNCLVSDKIINFENLGLDEKTYQKRWKGPYMDDTPEEFLYDCWKTPFVMIRYEKGLYLWSAGYDGEFDPIDRVLDSSYEGNDLMMTISRFRKSVGKTSTLAVTSYAKKLQIPGGTWTPPTLLDEIQSGFEHGFFNCISD